MNKIKCITITLLLLFLLIGIPQSFALENASINDNPDNSLISLDEKSYDDTSLTNSNEDALNEDNNQDTSLISENHHLDENYYYNSINENNSDKLEYTPYTFTEDKIKSNSKIYLSKGEYEIKNNHSYINISFEGENTENTILNGNGHTLTINEYANFKNITLKNIKITNNNKLTLTATNTIFKDCINENGYGGAIYSPNKATITLTNCTFYDNSAHHGGAIYLNLGSIKIYNSTFKNNSAYYGGAVYASESSLESHNNIFKDNTAQILGGGITSIESKKLEFNDDNFLNNNAGFEGGAIYSFYGTSKITYSKFINNSANAGGALFIDNNTKVTITNNEFENNYAKDIAGAIYSLKNLNPIIYNNKYKGNLAKTNENLFETNTPYMFISNGNNIIYKYNPIFNGTLPSSYDLRNYNYVTPVKDQGSGGNCWAFASLAALESCILKASDTNYDLSEENMKNLMALYSDYGWNMTPNDGGYIDMAIGYLISWLGPINETDDKYNPKSKISLISNNIIQIQNIVYLTRTSYDDRDNIKKAIMDYGAVATTVAWYDEYFDENEINYYCFNDEEKINHAVTIVGWDDNYSRNNFGSTEIEDGAWIIKNSWGVNDGETGYYYVSYYDKSIALPNKSDTYTFILNDTIKFDKNYQYDIPGKTDYFLNSTSTVWYKNIFNATDNEYLAAVSTFFNKNTTYDLSIYVNNALKLTQSGFSNEGYYTLNLNEFIPLNMGDIFEIIFKITVDGDAGVPISEKVSLNNYFYKEGISFLSYDGENWKDLYNLIWEYPNHTYKSQVACIKAFTLVPIATQISITTSNEYNPIEISAKIMTKDGYNITEGTVTFTVDNEDIIANINNGIAKIIYNFKNIGANTIIAKFNGDYYYSTSTNTKNINIKSTIDSEDEIKTYNSKYQFKLLNQGKAAKNQQTRVTIGSEIYTVTTNENGIATIDINLNPGTYIITIKNPINNEIRKQTITVLKRISENNDLTLDYSADGDYKVKVLDDDGNIAKGVQVTFTINGQSYISTTDNNGYASFKINNLNPNIYTITAEYKGYLVTNKITIKTKPTPVNPSETITPTKKPVKALKVSITLTKTSKTISKKAKKLLIQITLKIDKKLAKEKIVTYRINGKKYKVKTNKKGIAKLNLKKSQLKKIFKKVKVGKKVKYQIKYGNTQITRYIKVKK